MIQLNCISCGTPNTEGAKHCHQCGKALGNEIREQLEANQEAAPTAEAPSGTYRFQPAQENIQVHNAETFSNSQQSNNSAKNNTASIATSNVLAYAKHYFHYAWNILKKPDEHAYNNDRHTLFYGLVNIIAFALFFGLSTWIVFAKYTEVTFLGQGYKLSFFTVFIKPFIISAIVLGLGGGVTYLLLMLHKRKEHILDVLSKWFAYMTLPAALMPIVFICVSVNLLKPAIVFFALAMILLLVSSASIVKQYRLGAEGNIDYSYTVAISFVVNGLLIYLMINNIVGTVLDFIQGYFGNFFDGLFG